MRRLYIIILFLSLLTAALLARRTARSARIINAPARVARTNAAPMRLSRAPRHYDTPWQAWEAQDYPSFIGMLRASGCPEQTIQEIVLMQIARDFTARRLALEEARHDSGEWWRCAHNNADAVQGVRDWSHLRLEMARRVYELLGVELPELNARFFVDSKPPDTWLTPEKRLRLAELEQQFKDESTDIRLGSLGWWGPMEQEQKDRVSDLEKQKREALAAVLTPAELEEYDMRQSDARWFVLQQLRPATSEQEFRTMVRLAMDFGFPVNYTGNSMDPDYKAQVAAFQAKIDAALGYRAVASQVATAQAQTQAEAENEARAKAEEQDYLEEQFRAAFPQVAQEIGVDPALASTLFEQFKALKQANSNITDQIAEQMAVDLMGEKGHEFVKRMIEREKKM